MNKNKVVALIRRQHFFPLVLFFIIFITFGLLTPWLGFQGDDWHLIWLNYRINNLDPFFNLTRFSTQWLYQLIMPWMAPVAWQWFLLANLFRWLTGLSIFGLSIKLFPDHKKQAGIFTLLFCLYPGYLISYLPVTLLTGYIQPFCLFLSFYLMVLWMDNDNGKGWLLGLSMAASLANLLLSEYFFFLELLRPLIIWQVLKRKEEKKTLISSVLEHWKYFLGIFILILGVRILTQILGAGKAITTFHKFALQPGPAVSQLLQQILHDFYTVIIRPFFASFTPQVDLSYPQGKMLFLASLLIGLITLVYLLFEQSLENKQKMNWLAMLGFGLFTFLLAGVPFWLAGLQPFFGFDMKNRYALTQALSFAFFLFTFLNLIPYRWKVLKAILFAFLASLFAGEQLQAAAQVKAEWDQQRWLFWQLAWRAPQLKRGSVILMNDPGFQLSGENSVSAELNWNYIDDIHPQQADYFLYFDEHRFLSDFPDFPINKSMNIPHMFGPVKVNPSQLVVLHFSSTGCLRFLDPQIDKLDSTISDFTHKYIRFSNLSVIQAINPDESRRLDPAIFWDEPEHGWCYFFQKADLARQLGDWQAVVKYGNLALTHMTANYDYAEIRPYIEGYAHTDDWLKSKQLTENILNSSAGNNRLMCALWQRIDQSTPASPQKNNALIWMTSKTGCNF